MSNDRNGGPSRMPNPAPPAGGPVPDNPVGPDAPHASNFIRDTILHDLANDKNGGGNAF